MNQTNKIRLKRLVLAVLILAPVAQGCGPSPDPQTPAAAPAAGGGCTPPATGGGCTPPPIGGGCTPSLGGGCTPPAGGGCTPNRVTVDLPTQPAAAASTPAPAPAAPTYGEQARPTGTLAEKL